MTDTAHELRAGRRPRLITPPPDVTWYSASQVDCFLLCPRKWAYRYLDGLPQKPADPSRDLGLATHEVLKNWLATATPIDVESSAGKIALRGIALLPPPKAEGLAVEGWFGLRIGGFWFQGYKDVQILRPNQTPVVIDHKTTKDLYRAQRKLDALGDGSDEDLMQDTQACLYAADAMVKAGSETCELKWIYYPTSKDAPAVPVAFTMTRAETEPVLARTVQAVRRMQVIRDAGVTAREVPCDPSACRAFGGCDYQKLCGEFTPAERMVGMGTLEVDSFLDSLKKKPPAINPPPTTPAPAAKREPEVQPSPAPTTNRDPLLPPPPSSPTEVVIPTGTTKNALPTVPAPVESNNAGKLTKKDRAAAIAAAPASHTAAIGKFLVAVGRALTDLGADLQGAA